MKLSRMEEQALIRAAQIALRRVILANFPPGPERDKRFEWLERAVSGKQEAMRALKLLGGRRRIAVGRYLIILPWRFAACARTAANMTTN